MKLTPDQARGPSITGYGSDWISVNAQKFSSNLIVDAQSGASPWSCSNFDALTQSHFDSLLELKPELILFGSGTPLRFPHPRLLQNLYANRVGVEVMDTPAACRTFNFLAAEGRKVVAALLL